MKNAADPRRQLRCWLLARRPAPSLCSRRRRGSRCELQDYAALPVTADNTNTNTRAQLAARQLHARRAGRPPVLRQRPQRAALHPRQADEGLHHLSEFQRPRRTPRPVSEVHLRAQLRHRPHELHLRSGLREERRVLHAPHGRPGDRRPGGAKGRRALRGSISTGYTTTPAIPTPTVGGRIDREVVLIEWTDRNPSNTHVRGHGAGVDARAASAGAASVGRDDVQPGRTPRRSRLARHVLGAGDAQSGEQRDSRRLNPQRLDTLVGKILRIVPDLREHTKTSAGQRERPLPHPQRQPVRVDRRRAQGDLGLRPAQPSSPGLGRGPGAGPRARRSLLAFNIGLVSLGDGRRRP